MTEYLRVNKKESPKNYKKIDKWYWISIFSNRYDQGVDSTIVNDINLMRRWVDDDSALPDFVKDFSLNDIDLDVESKSSAIYKGVINLVVLNGALDFKTGVAPQFKEDRVQDDHIFPKSKYNENRITNKTLISTNQSKFSKTPSDYFTERLEEHGEKKLKELLNTHLIPEEALDLLLKNNTEGFIRLRKKAILEEIKARIS